MLGKSTPVFLLIPKPGQQKKILHGGNVIESSAASFTAEFEEPIAPSIGAEVVAFGEVGGKFFQQGATVTAIAEPGERPIIAFARVGEVVSAEQRQTYRVCTVALDVVARINKEEPCQVVDISPEGFAAVARGAYELGATVQISIAHGRHTLSASARVQTARQRPDGKYRYGFLVSSQNAAARKTLEALSSAAQRAQLKRLAGAA